MDSKESGFTPFRAGDVQRRKPSPGATDKASTTPERHYPFLEKLLESSEEDIERFQTACQATCRNLDSIISRQSDPRTTATGQAALASYGHSLKLFAELLEIKYSQLRHQAEQK